MHITAVSKISFLALTLAVPLACGDSGAAETGDTLTTGEPGTTGDAPTTSGTGDAPTTSGDDSGTGGPPDFYACEEKMFAAAPLAGPKFDAGNGGIQGELQPGYVLHTTQIYIKPEGAQTFTDLAGQISAEAQKIDGLIAYSVGSDGGCGVARTIGIWASEEAMYKLVTSEVHARAMAMTTTLSYTGRVTHWTATAEEANAYGWDVARAKLEGVEPSPIY